MDRLDKQILYALSGDLELSFEPFKRIGEQLGVHETEVIQRIKVLQERGILKRIAPILYHQRTTFQYNALTLWAIEESKVDDVADFLMSFKHISHVYTRQTHEEWPYNLYGMLHGKNEAELEEVVKKIQAETGSVPYKVIYTTKEWKKTSPDLKYLLEKKAVE